MLLPPCPLRLQPSFVWKYQLGGLALLAVGLSAGAGYAIWQYGAMGELLEQTRIWQAGVPALRVEVSGKETTHKAVFHSYELNVKYVDAGFSKHEGTVKFDTLFTGINQAAEPSVRYLKESPGRFALSWAMEVTGSRWSSIGFMMVAGLALVGGSFSYLGWLALRRLAEARRCAVRADEVVVQITKVKPQNVHGHVTANEYHFTGATPDGREVKGKVTFPVKFEPLWADGTRQRMLALVPPENLKRAVVLRADFTPFELTPEEQARVRAGIAARS